MKTCFTALLLFSAAATAQAQPVIKTGGVVNSASYAATGLPNAAIAQGSLFTVFGTGLGPSALQQITAYPLTATLGGTSLTVSVNGATTKPLLIYTSAGQVGAILPSTMPVGTGTISLTYNGKLARLSRYKWLQAALESTPQIKRVAVQESLRIRTTAARA